jgi:hypothetical protein
MKPDFQTYISQVVSATMKEGGTASRPKTCEFLPARDLWSFPKYPARTAILPATVNLRDELKNFITANETFLDEADCWLGTWINPASGEYYLDVATGCEDLSEAKDMCAQAGIREGRAVVALFNSKRNETLFL